LQRTPPRILAQLYQHSHLLFVDTERFAAVSTSTALVFVLVKDPLKVRERPAQTLDNTVRVFEPLGCAVVSALELLLLHLPLQPVDALLQLPRHTRVLDGAELL
jgi:hypothetical protein